MKIVFTLFFVLTFNVSPRHKFMRTIATYSVENIACESFAMIALCILGKTETRCRKKYENVENYKDIITNNLLSTGFCFLSLLKKLTINFN